jgi:hypothetical protein
MPVKKKDKKAKPKPKTRTITKTKNVNTNVNNVHVHVEKKPRKRRTTKPKSETPNDNQLSNSKGVSRPSSQNLGFHPRGLINNEPQQPTIIQQITQPDQRLEKLEKRTKKIKEYLKGKGDTKENPINIESPTFKDAFKTPAPTADIFSDAIEPRRINFESVPNEKQKKGLFSRIFTSSKKKEQKQEGFPLLEYKPHKHPATAPAFTQTESIETQTTPVPTGHSINQELKNLVNQLHAAHPKSKIHMATFRSAISRKLKDLGVDSQHTATYVDKMRRFYDDIYAASNGGDASGGVM